MESKDLVSKIAPHTLVNYSLLKRLFPQVSPKDLKANLEQAIGEQLLVVHEFPNLRCFSLTAKGFALLDIVHMPSLYFTEQQADTICRVNHFRKGFEESIQSQDDLHLDKWISGSKFAKSPLFVKVRLTEQELLPCGAAVISDASGRQKLFFVHVFDGQQTFHSDMNLYRLFCERGLHAKRFFLRPDTPVRVIVLLPSYKQLYQMKSHLRSSFYSNVLFLPVSHVHHDEVLKYKIFIDYQAEKHAVLHAAR